MPLQVTDYLIDQKGIDWSKALESWSWLVPREFTLWLVNRFADLLLVLRDGTVHMLDVGAGTLMIPLVDRIVAAGIHLETGQCYGFKKSPVIGGEYTVENVVALPIWDYLGAYGLFHVQIHDLPDGTEVALKVIKA